MELQMSLFTMMENEYCILPVINPFQQETE